MASPRPSLSNRSALKQTQSSEMNDTEIDQNSKDIDVEVMNSNLSECMDSQKSIIVLIFTFCISLMLLGTVYYNLPDFNEEESKGFKLPRDIEDAKVLGQILFKYKESHYIPVVFGFFITYVFLQAFAIPGSIFLSIMSGFLFPFYLAIFCVCLASAMGASCCYMLSYLVGKRLVWSYLPNRALEWSNKAQRHREHILNYIIFLRITPFLPNWFINIVSPIINIQLVPFFIGTFIGVAPPSFLAIQAGTTLQQLTSSRETVSMTSIIILTVLALLSMVPVLFKNYIKKKFD